MPGKTDNEERYIHLSLIQNIDHDCDLQTPYLFQYLACYVIHHFYTQITIISLLEYHAQGQ